MKYRAATVAVVSVGILIAATACSSGTSTGGSSSPATKSASAKTYKAKDLPSILTTAEKKVGVSGTILDDSQVEAKLKQAQGSSGISSLLSQKGVTITPAACGQLVKDNLTTTPPSGTINSILTYGSSAVTVTAISGSKLPSSLTSGAAAKQAKVLSQCGTMKISVTQSGQTIAIPLTIKKVDVSTNADTTNAFEETVTTPSTTGGAGTPVSIQVITAIAGNLYITAQGSSTATTAASTPSASAQPPLADVVNAIVAAAE